MAKQRFLNNFNTTFIASVNDAPSTGTPTTELGYGVLRLSDGAAGALTNPTGGDYYVLTAFKRTGSVESNIEIMRVTAVDNSTPGECRVSVLRAQEGTTAKTFVPGDYLSLRMTRGTAEGFAQPDDMAQKVDKVAGKGLSTEDYTTAEKTKLAGVTDGAQINTVDSVAGRGGAVVLAKTDVGLGNVDNTSDLDKPVSTATGAAIAASTAANIHAATSKATPANADELGITDSAASWGLKKLTFTNLAAWVRGINLSGLSIVTSTAITASDTVLGALGKLQAQVSAKQDTLIDSLTITYNGDGTVATLTEDGVVKTFAYNGDGTINTVSWPVGALTRTETYSYTSGVLTGMTAVEA